MTLSHPYQNGFWFQKGHLLDVDRGTQLGTLGFLPVEIRRKIWYYVIDHQKIEKMCTAKHPDQKTVDLSDGIFWSPDRKPPDKKWMKGRRIWSPRHASADISFEFDRLLFSIYAVLCKRPRELQTFLDRIQILERRYPEMVIPIRLEVHLLFEPDWMVRYRGENAWSRAFLWVPSSLVSVVFVLYQDERDTSHEMWLLQCLNQRIADQAPKATTSIRWVPRQRWTPFDSMADDDRAALESCLRNAGE